MWEREDGAEWNEIENGSALVVRTVRALLVRTVRAKVNEVSNQW